MDEHVTVPLLALAQVNDACPKQLQQIIVAIVAKIILMLVMLHPGSLIYWFGIMVFWSFQSFYEVILLL